MTTSLTTKLSVSLSGKLVSTVDGGQAPAEQAFSFSDTLENGTTNAQADLMWFDERTLASNSSENLDLAGSLASVFGATLTFAEICAIYFESDDANTTNLSLGGAASNTFVGWFADATDIEVIKPGGFTYHYAPAGWTVTAATGDILKVANATGASAVYRVGIIGRSA